MPTTEDIRRKVVESLVLYISHQPLGRRLKVPVYRTIHNHTELRNLGLNHRDGRSFMDLLVKNKLCRPMGIHITAHWTTVEKVVASVIQHPPAK